MKKKTFGIYTHQGLGMGTVEARSAKAALRKYKEQNPGTITRGWFAEEVDA
jgi:hypothetical protein